MNKKIHPALKHGAYSATAVLPGEKQTEFKKQHDNLVAEFVPNGAFEDDLIMTVARLIWRRSRLGILNTAEHGHKRCSEILFEKSNEAFLVQEESILAKHKSVRQAAEEQAQNELGDAYELTQIGDAATFDGLKKELEIRERLDAAIARCLKILLLARGVKSVSAAPPSPSPKCINGSSEAA